MTFFLQLKKMFYKIVVLVALTVVSGDLTVDQYDDMINNVIEKTKTFKYPTSARDFVSGNYDTKGCINGGIYDFIIVGAGSAGTVLANRLSEVAKWRILLLEAGGEENDFTDIPSMFDYLRLTEFNWGYKSVPQKNSLLSFLNNSEIIPRGKVLGGSSTLNAMMYVRGNKLDYKNWFDLGNPGWSYEELLPYFKKSENATIAMEDPGYHGHNGPLHVQNVDVLTPITQAFLDANKELSRKLLDYNGNDQMGYSLLQLNQINGRRDSGAKAFLKPVRSRNNLKVLTKAFVAELILHKNHVTGVKYMQNGKTYCVHSSKEVVLSAGAINSPQLLMLAGIGPEKHLKELGIKVVKNLPVGQNMWDHICMALQPFTTNLTLKDETQKELIQKYLKGKGFFTSSDAIQDIGFNRLYWSNKQIPDVEHILRAVKMPVFPYEYYKQTKNMNQDVYENILKPLEGKVIWQSYAVLLNPESRGTIRLKSKDPFDFALIDPNYFSDPKESDLNTLVAAMKDMIKISDTRAMQRFNSTIFKIRLRNCRYDFGTDDYYKCLIKNLANTLHHFSGACRMGPVRDRSSVVGPDLSVHGVGGIRVADCSVIPVTISGHTNAVAYMIGEKASDMIKKSWHSKRHLKH